MAAVTTCSDLRAQKNKVCHCLKNIEIVFSFQDAEKKTGSEQIWPRAEICQLLDEIISESPSNIIFYYLKSWVNCSSFSFLFLEGWPRTCLFCVTWETSEDILSPKRCLPTSQCCALLSCFSHVWFFATPWTLAHQASPSMGFSKQEYCSGLGSASDTSSSTFRTALTKTVQATSQIEYLKCG